MNSKITIRPEEHKDYKDIVSLILRSFQEGTDYSDGTDIIALVEEIRNSEFRIRFTFGISCGKVYLKYVCRKIFLKKSDFGLKFLKFVPIKIIEADFVRTEHNMSAKNNFCTV